ncbi:MAG: hypothetical protein IJ551_09460 [Prevotella sp.]|nr:hypothetical protein [Prevotella sp.]
MTKIEIFKRMLDWIYANKLAANQTEVGRQAGINEVHVSRILNGYVKSVKQETLWKVNAAYGNVFNPDWMRGESDVMLIADLAPAKGAVSIGTHAPSSPTPPPTPGVDALTAALLAAKDETIAALRAQLAEKDRTIATKDDVIASKDAHISTLQQQVMGLRTKLAVEKGLLTDGTHTSEHAEKQARIYQDT